MNLVGPIKDLEKVKEIKNILLHTSYRDYFLFVFGINVGIRISHYLSFQVKDVKNKDCISFQEGNIKQHFISDYLRKEIDEYTSTKSLNDFLFPSQKGDHLGRIQANHILKHAGIKAGIGSISAHTLRKTFGYHHFLKYHDVGFLQQLFGHASASVTLKYIGLSSEEINSFMKDFSL